ncbi:MULTISPECIES: DUF6461 domain-containing protein [Streptomyces]|uniref:SMI1/KNR4 family protein n=1 Tax=Streptomyces koelreuteriae TaxID=2838015 RepID=A0ABX8FJ77_9ACTN|nr:MULTISPECIES: DUF6461 domain-containing protein [Streptomyces]QWB21151.1 hypothetical protein KJK29_00390 [Streptomyces koelreuteriae]UUA04064.1 DUF6461 domain-containing protein [Streptomyces koelreuteriae]UUA11690.1 DUF6461 domain-containing protein [Streptomyces sp. CRCS-T-1]
MEADADAGLPDWARAWMCVTFTRGLGPEEVFARYGADPERARLLGWDEASDLPSGESGDGMVSLLRAGRIGEWGFCVEVDGGIGSEEESLAELSRGTETYSVATTEGIDVFQYWRDGERIECFEPGMEHSRSEPLGPWWDRVEEALAAHEGEGAGMAPAVALILDHLGITLDDAALAGPWPSLTLAKGTALAAPLGDTYAGEGPVPPGTVLDFGPSSGLS